MPDDLTDAEEALAAAGMALIAARNWLAHARARQTVNRDELRRAQRAVAESSAAFKRALAGAGGGGARDGVGGGSGIGWHDCRSCRSVVNDLRPV